ncbi:uncharacterized protein Pyn_34153 [Prunus yedoensis var. nudiflora]|uniref:Uncharacterized protein n=1 Tax=Prunus yedoensis var. nudiflora TaxID=2094558 RepID=A0A314ZKD0_PRUYE|nr:uncharacterized protein Pyn_34153 [Prunus yedoensis var. nudiflora]
MRCLPLRPRRLVGYCNPGFMVSYIVDALIFKYVAFFGVWLSLIFFNYFLLTTFTSFPHAALAAFLYAETNFLVGV